MARPRSGTRAAAAPKNFQRHLERAIAHNAENPKRKSLSILYKKKNGRTVRRKIDPLSLKNGLVTAYDHKRGNFRSFHIERMQKMEKTAFWAGFEKASSGASLGSNLREVGFLTTLGVPAALEASGHKVSDRTKHISEGVGLTGLAAPYAWNAAKQIGSKLKPLLHKA